MAVTMCQAMGFVLGVLGLAGTISSTAMDMWSTQDLNDGLVTSIYSYSGLWRTCVRQISGFTECRPFYTILGLPAMLQAVRALMIVGVVLGTIGVLVAIFALKCLKVGHIEDHVKATMTLSAGVAFILAGICAIAGASVFANMIVSNFRWTTLTSSDLGGFGGGLGGMGGFAGSPIAPRYTFGSALFVGWIGGAILVVGGVMMCIACRGMMPQDERYGRGAYKAQAHSVTFRSEAKSHQPFNDSRRQSMERQKFDYV